MTTDLPDSIRIRRRKLSEYRKDPHNANRGTTRGREMLARSVAEVGVGRSLVAAADDALPAGNQTQDILLSAGIEDVIEIETDGDEVVVVKRADWPSVDHPAARRYAYYDNRTGQLNLAWDVDRLLADLDQGVDLTGIFEKDELTALLAAAAATPSAEPSAEAQAQAARRTLAERFIVPPFSVLDARQGYWQTRKNAWVALGIRSELGGREKLKTTGSLSGSDPAYYRIKRQIEQYLGHAISNEEFERQYYVPFKNSRLAATETGGVISIFDPVLSELAYRWFCPPQGAVLDPFAGGSVRGIVAAMLGRTYTGIDLRPEQVAANEDQSRAILRDAPDAPAVDPDAPAQVKISARSLRLRFNGCDPDYIRTVCRGACCESSTSPTGTLITIHPSEQPRIEARGGAVIDGLLQPRPGERRCPFKTADHLCGLHGTPDKPFGCIASPFTLNRNDTLIVRHRYTRLKCYNDGARLPAYVAFRASLDLLFGPDEAQRICDHLDAGDGDLLATMPRATYNLLHDNDAIKHGAPSASVGSGDTPLPRWIVGDSRDLDRHLGPDEQFDFIFTCPPYFDLEIYSDDPADLSNAGDYAAFLDAYRAIIAASAARLREHRFACFVVGDMRDRQGMYRNFVSDTIAAFLDAGLTLYNEAIFVTPAGSLPIRVGNQFEISRKLGKMHQNVLVFVKGDPREAVEAIGSIEYGTFDLDTLAEQT